MMLLQRLARPLPDVARPLFPELRQELDRLFENFLGPDNQVFSPSAFPALNMWEDEQRLYVEAEVPGIDLKDLEINVQGNELSVKGRRNMIEDENVTYLRRERGAGEFVRFLTLPVEVDAERVEATLKDGVLNIALPKAETARARKITVKTA
jgi:HSP20 family protein